MLNGKKSATHTQTHIHTLTTTYEYHQRNGENKAYFWTKNTEFTDVIRLNENKKNMKKHFPYFWLTRHTVQWKIYAKRIVAIAHSVSRAYIFSSFAIDQKYYKMQKTTLFNFLSLLHRHRLCHDIRMPHRNTWI